MGIAGDIGGALDFIPGAKWAGGAIDDITGGIGGAIGDAWEGYRDLGKNEFTEGGYREQPFYWGGDEQAAQKYANVGLQQMGRSRAGNEFALEEFANQRGPMAVENQALADREAQSRYLDQGRALAMAEEGVKWGSTAGNSVLQQGLNNANAMQSAAAGGARGNAALAQAQQQAAGNQIALGAQSQLNAAQMTAGFQAQSAKQYGDMANAIRQGDQNRLNIANQNSQFNAGLNDQYRMGMGQMAQGFGNQGAQYYTAAANPYNQQAQMNNYTAQRSADNYNQMQNRRAGVMQSNTDAKAGQVNALISGVSGAAGSAFKGIGGSNA